MKNDTTVTLLNFVLLVLVISCVTFAVMTLSRTSELRQLSIGAGVAQSNLARANALLNDVAAYNATAKSPELTRAIGLVQDKPAVQK